MAFQGCPRLFSRQLFSRRLFFRRRALSPSHSLTLSPSRPPPLSPSRLLTLRAPCADRAGRYWLSVRNRRSHSPGLPVVPVPLEVEMAYNPYFGGLHTAADALALALRRLALAHPHQVPPCCPRFWVHRTLPKALLAHPI